MTALLERARRDLAAGHGELRAAIDALHRAAHERRHTSVGTQERAIVEGATKMALYDRDLAERKIETAHAAIARELGRADRQLRARLVPPEGCTCPDWGAGDLAPDCPRHLWTMETAT